MKKYMISKKKIENFFNYFPNSNQSIKCAISNQASKQASK